MRKITKWIYVGFYALSLQKFFGVSALLWMVGIGSFFLQLFGANGFRTIWFLPDRISAHVCFFCRFRNSIQSSMVCSTVAIWRIWLIFCSLIHFCFYLIFINYEWLNLWLWHRINTALYLSTSILMQNNSYHYKGAFCFATHNSEKRKYIEIMIHQSHWIYFLLLSKWNFPIFFYSYSFTGR